MDLLQEISTFKINGHSIEDILANSLENIDNGSASLEDMDAIIKTCAKINRLHKKAIKLHGKLLFGPISKDEAKDTLNELDKIRVEFNKIKEFKTNVVRSTMSKLIAKGHSFDGTEAGITDGIVVTRLK
ncbi:hypothetical protein LJC52_04505 [Bacteroidales bacterium OttesenSCG-928-A17]|nr:hypothetical protein [Bacteroidales bacterium OttesenSCG-928-A17]